MIMETPLVFNARDIDEMAGAFAGWQMEVIQQDIGTFHGKLHGYSRLDGRINFYSAYVDKRVFANGHHLEGSVMFNFIECPKKCTWNGEQIKPSTLFVSDAERGLDIDAGAGFVSYSVSIERSLLEGWLRKEGMVIPHNWNFFIDFQKHKRTEVAINFRNLIFSAVYLGNFDLMEFKWALFRLLETDTYQFRNHIAVNFVPIHETVEMIHQTLRIGKEVSLETVVEFYGGPMRTFYYNFRRYTGFTPSQYIKNLRLAMVRKLLKRGNPNVGEVKNIAYQFGFRHMGQFAMDYRKLFGETPSETLKQGY
jgi:AraC-like DNA-binding protein